MDSKGNLYLDSAIGEVISLDNSGVEKWRAKPLKYVNEFSEFHPHLSENGLLYLLTEDGLHALNTRDGTVLVPFRSLFENAGLKVTWDPDSKTITGTKESLSIKLTIGEKIAFINGQAHELNESPLIENNSSFVRRVSICNTKLGRLWRMSLTILRTIQMTIIVI